MSVIQILDCTLRDGGYINDWNFGYHKIKSIINRLTKAGVDIIECGFLEDGEYSIEQSLFNNVEQIEDMLPLERNNSQYVAMTRYGHLDVNNLKPYDGNSINGIRVTFHEDEAEEAIEFCKLLQNKGYKVYVQPVGTTSYTDSFLLKILEIVNSIRPYAFYIVDTLGLMKKNDLLRLFYLIDNNLGKDIKIGFHSHNNLQLSFSNAQELAELHTRRSIILDSSVYGMGRGAGNLNTELITQHLNLLKNTHYSTEYILEIIDETIEPLREKYTWGYSAPYYLAAINNCHPNYATYLMNRKTLPVKSIASILNLISQEQRELYNQEYIFSLYQLFQQQQIDDRDALNDLLKLIDNRPIIIVAPGSSVAKQRKKILHYIEENRAMVITVNFNSKDIKSDICFFSNDRRYQNYKRGHDNSTLNQHHLVLTSNIEENKFNHIKINYSSYLNSQSSANDNATLMLLSVLIKLGIQQVTIAGFDGFQANLSEHYIEDDLETSLDRDSLLDLNQQISYVLQEYGRDIVINFITESVYQYRSFALVSRGQR